MPNVNPPDELNYGYYHSLASQKIFEDYIPINISGRKYEDIKISTDRTIIKLIDKIQTELISCICGRMVTYHGRDYFEIQWTYSKVQRAGFLTYLFELIIYDLELIILSDSTHTSPGSKEFWQSHIHKSKFEIYRYDIVSNYKRKASSFKEDQIWGLTKSEKEKIDAKLDYFDSLGFDVSTIEQDPYSINEDVEASDDEIPSELLDQYNEQVGEVDPLIMKFEKFKDKYRDKIKSMENIRLIAQRST